VIKASPKTPPALSVCGCFGPSASRPVAYAFRDVLVGFFLHFVVAAGVRYCYGQGVGDALGLEPVGPEWTDADEAARTAGDALTSTGADVDPDDDPLR